MSLTNATNRKNPKGDLRPSLFAPHESNKRKDPKVTYGSGRFSQCHYFSPNESNKNKNPKGDLRLHRFLNVMFTPARATKGKNPKGDLRLNRHYFPPREPQKARTRRVTYGWAVIMFKQKKTKATKGTNPKGDLRLDRHCSITRGTTREEPEG